MACGGHRQHAHAPPVFLNFQSLEWLVAVCIIRPLNHIVTMTIADANKWIAYFYKKDDNT
jgi:hypothetical protein